MMGLLCFDVSPSALLKRSALLACTAHSRAKGGGRGPERGRVCVCVCYVLFSLLAQAFNPGSEGSGQARCTWWTLALHPASKQGTSGVYQNTLTQPRCSV